MIFLCIQKNLKNGVVLPSEEKTNNSDGLSKDNHKHSICDNYFLPVLSKIIINSFKENF